MVVIGEEEGGKRRNGASYLPVVNLHDFRSDGLQHTLAAVRIEPCVLSVGIEFQEPESLWVTKEVQPAEVMACLVHELLHLRLLRTT